MALPNPVLFELKALPSTRAATEKLQMDQAEFQAVYDQTSRGIWAFLFRRTGSESVADDLLQETYYRFLKTRREYDSAAHRRNYLFRIAANVANDAVRKKTEVTMDSPDQADHVASKAPDAATMTEKKTDLARALEELPERQRQALWLAYAEGSTHKEIAGILGMRQSSIKPMLFRARARLASILRGEEGNS